MKRNIKLCKGFDDVDCCKVCKRRKDKADLLVKFVPIGTDNKHYCNLFLYK